VTTTYPRGTSGLVKTAVVLFAVGLTAVLAVFVLYALGQHDLPLWVSLSAGLFVPASLVLGILGLMRESKKLSD
jgi:hypothetical protein